MYTKLKKKKSTWKKKIKAEGDEPGALIRKANTLPKPNTKIGLAIRGLI